MCYIDSKQCLGDLDELETVLTILFQMNQRGQSDCLEEQKMFLCLVKT